MFSKGVRSVPIFTAFAFLASLVAVTPATADIPAPEHRRPHVVVQRTESDDVAQLIIPRQFLPGGDAKLGGSSGTTQTVIAGLALSGGIILCGLVLRRRRGSSAPSPVALVLVAALGGVAAGYAWADLPRPFGGNAARRPGPPPQTVVAARPVSIVVVDEGNTIKLILDREADITP